MLGFGSTVANLPVILCCKVDAPDDMVIEGEANEALADESEVREGSTTAGARANGVELPGTDGWKLGPDSGGGEPKAVGRTPDVGGEP